MIFAGIAVPLIGTALGGDDGLRAAAPAEIGEWVRDFRAELLNGVHRGCRDLAKGFAGAEV
jgi:hypothetical protein